MDVGSVAGYVRANVEWLAVAGAGSFVGEGASVEPTVRLESSVVGAGARVAGAGALVRCVVWPGATATAPLEDAVVTSAGVVRC